MLDDKEEEEKFMTKRTFFDVDQDSIVSSSTTVGYNMSCELRPWVPEYPWLGGT